MKTMECHGSFFFGTTPGGRQVLGNLPDAPHEWTRAVSKDYNSLAYLDDSPHKWSRGGADEVNVLSYLDDSAHKWGQHRPEVREGVGPASYGGERGGMNWINR